MAIITEKGKLEDNGSGGSVVTIYLPNTPIAEAEPFITYIATGLGWNQNVGTSAFNFVASKTLEFWRENGKAVLIELAQRQAAITVAAQVDASLGVIAE